MAEFEFDHRDPQSPYVDVIWRTRTGDVAPDETFMSIAEPHWSMVITTMWDKTTLTMRGPETRATPAGIPPNADIFGVNFKLGTFMPHMLPAVLVDAPVDLPAATGKSFWLHGSQWELPTFENVETFLDRLIRRSMLLRDPVVDDALQGRMPDLSLRSVQRRFLNATGLTQGSVHKITRARRAVELLENGVSILDAVEQAGYADQPHMTRELRYLMGATPAQIQRHIARSP